MKSEKGTNKKKSFISSCHCDRIAVPRALSSLDSLYLMERSNNYVGAYLEIFRLKDADTVFLSRRELFIHPALASAWEWQRDLGLASPDRI